ncbi:TauD/TfdA family dioxygenase [Planktothrix sp. FACHB-1355]|uniref:TauD/TfdA family dioxygenase n=1 Tax=Aerosakkonema funiforme FACHB-1375 TaxID=2949571 RepID=A0A926VKD8_9CYAN|nr:MULTISPECIES: TauD/TfdA family dioxygenase [Oscillatoriales]MBD2184863.1 TauD/TfdA family dioxygenase [Aerosakkonema funiforme FACHB-1375]MBD3558440.1 TauD/TfdA family dioxygenase [Planktothrix sp. FACHB-1355]
MFNHNYLTVEDKRFHYIWLRDNCLCPQCRHPTSFQKIHNISDRTTPPKPLSAELGKEELTIDWDENPSHQSIFPLSWLMIHAYDQPHRRREKGKEEKILWDKSGIEAYSLQYHDFPNCDRTSWVKELFQLGFTFLENMKLEELAPFLADNIGPIYHTEYGAFAPVKFKPGANDLGETDYPLSPHTDYPYRYNHPLLVCFYMVENTVMGGESVLVDGFRIAQDFRKDHPDYFQILAQTPIQFQQFYTEFQYYYQRTQTLLKLDYQGEVEEITFGHSHVYNWDLPFEEMEEFYAAYSAFFRYLENPDYQYCIRLQPGNCLLMQNARILHGRKAFSTNSGSRHLEVVYLSWDYFTGRHNFEQHKHLYLSNN